MGTTRRKLSSVSDKAVLVLAKTIQIVILADEIYFRRLECPEQIVFIKVNYGGRTASGEDGHFISSLILPLKWRGKIAS